MITKGIKQKLFEFFLNNPTKRLRLRHIEKHTNLPFPSVSKYTKELTNESLLKATTIENITLYSANLESNQYKLEKKLFNLRQIYESELISNLQINLFNPGVILFGSFSKGEDIETSDIDLYIETPSKVNIKLDEFEKKLQKKIQIFRHKTITDIKNKNLANNILNGITLSGSIKVFEDEQLE